MMMITFAQLPTLLPIFYNTHLTPATNTQTFLPSPQKTDLQKTKPIVVKIISNLKKIISKII